MNAFRHVWPLYAALLLCPSAAIAANHEVMVTNNSFSPEELTVQLGDTVTFRNSGGLHNAASDPGAPVAFRCANGCSGSGGNGNPSAANWIAVVTMNATGLTRYFCEVHGGAGGIGMSGSISVVGAATDPPAARDDLVRLRIGDGPSDIDVLANDVVDAAALAGGSLTIVQVPAAGSASVHGGANAGTAADDVIRFTLPAGAAVDTVIGYRICDRDNRCDDGELRVLARALHDDDLALQVETDAGFVDRVLAALPDLPEARFQATALATPMAVQPNIPPDPTPATPWDADRAGSIFQLSTIPAPADGQPQAWGVVIDALPITAGNVDLFAGPDLDGDGLPDEDELRCTSAMSAGTERCELALTHPGSGELRYWLLVQNRSAAILGARVEWAHLPLRDGGAGLVMTGPGHLTVGAASAARLGWNDPGLLPGEVRMGFARVRPTSATGLGWVPVRLDRIDGDPVGRVLASGRDQALRLAAGGAHERLYIDVPPGATTLTVATASTSQIDLYVGRRATLTHPAIEPAPARIDAAASAITAGGNESLVLQPPLLVPGRWYVTPVNTGATAASLVVRATVAGTAPLVRSGSYFNPDRSGHGMFVYPAADQLAILWYHYFEDGSPTWYYLQGAQPGANGAWASGVYRAAWDGDSNHLTQVGSVTMVPSGPDAFTWSFDVDGRSGSEPLVALGRGCPTVEGVERDASSTWFDPLTAGTGYSVQLFPNYEYNAAFVYDGHGKPRYLAAELGSAGPAVATYSLEQLTGFCPLCERTAAPSRLPIGTYTRTFGADGRLARIEVDAIYSEGIAGFWTGDDAVQPLGGPATVQGCDL